MSICDSISVEESSGITFLQVDNAFATSRISLFGAHVLSFVPKSDNVDRLWLSPHAFLNGERPIRGGIPICWPWFADNHGREKGELPAHGFLRTQTWQIQSSEDTEAGTRIVLTPNFSRGEGFEYDCQVSYEILVGEQLSVTLKTENTGIVPFTFNAALHSYFAVESIGKTEITGIEGEYKDKLEDWAIKPTPSPYVFSGETIVVWNPWQGAASIADMDAFGYRHMLCIETSVTNGVTIEPDHAHSITQIVTPL